MFWWVYQKNGYKKKIVNEFEDTLSNSLTLKSRYELKDWRKLIMPQWLLGQKPEERSHQKLNWPEPWSWN